MGFLSDLVRSALLYFYNVTGNFGVAIILLTIVTRIILYPFMRNQVEMSAKMKVIQPEMKAIQAKYKDNPEEMNKRVLELYKKHNYNPISGCLPFLVQLPLIWAVFGALASFPEGMPPEALTFLGWNLAKPDPWYILPVLSGATTFWQMSQTATDPSQKSLLIIMPLFLVFMSARFSAGLVLYWTVGNLIAIAQQYLMQWRKQTAQGGGATA